MAVCTNCQKQCPWLTCCKALLMPVLCPVMVSKQLDLFLRVFFFLCCFFKYIWHSKIKFNSICSYHFSVKPEFTKDTFAIKQGRHPILERISADIPVPNNIVRKDHGLSWILLLFKWSKYNILFCFNLRVTFNLTLIHLCFNLQYATEDTNFNLITGANMVC